jgi:ribosomal protein S2
MTAARRRYASEGYTTLRKPPSLLFLVHQKKSRQLYFEARESLVPCAGIVDTNQDPREMMYPIPMNDENHVAMERVLEVISDCMKDAYEYKQRSTANGLNMNEFKIERPLGQQRPAPGFHSWNVEGRL